MNTIPSKASEQDRNSAYVAHIGPVLFAILSAWLATEFLSFRIAGFGGVLFAFIFWLVKKNNSVFIRKHATEAFNFNFSMFLYCVATLVLWELTDGMLFLILFPFAMVLMLLWIFCPIMAAKAEKNGDEYRYPITIRLLK